MKKRCTLKNKGYFFLIDSLIALGILTIGIFLIFTMYLRTPSKEEAEIVSEDVMDFFANNKIKDVNNPYAGVNGELWNQGLITNAENTLLQQVAEFYKNYTLNVGVDQTLAEQYLDTSKTFVEEFTQNAISSQYELEFWIQDTLLYPREASEAHNRSKSSTSVLIPSKKIVYGISNKENGEMFGPYSVRVLAWQQRT